MWRKTYGHSDITFHHDCTSYPYPQEALVSLVYNYYTVGRAKKKEEEKKRVYMGWLLKTPSGEWRKEYGMIVQGNFPKGKFWLDI